MSSRGLVLGALVATAAAALARPAAAQVSVEAQIGARQIEVGDSTQFQITALSASDDAPSSPRLPAVPGLDIQGPSLGSRTQVSINNGRMVQQRGISATWTIRGLKVGTYRVGPASIEVGGQRHQTNIATLEVVPQGALPRGRAPFDPFRFFDPFGSGSPFPGGLLGPNGFEDEQQEPAVPEEFRMDHAPDPIAFLRATVTPKHPVVGEQVTVKLYMYGGRGPYSGTNLVDFTHADFLDFSGQDDGDANETVRVPIDGTLYLARKVRELALFPLRAGHLVIGPASLTFTEGRYRANPPIVRSTGPLAVDVTEPPLDGRPAGYRLGDVGTLELTAAVDPRKITAGDSIGVIAKLEGTGSIPTALRVPEQRGVEWNEPTRVDEVHLEKGVVRGFRSLSYVVKLKEPGTIELGELNLPYWDPKRRAYAVARYGLGKVEVAPGAPKPVTSAPTKAPGADPLALTPRRALGGFAAEPAPFTDSLRFWLLLFGAPIAVALGGLGREVGGRVVQGRVRARSSPERLAQEALRAADIAARGSEIAKTAAAIERALFLAIEAGTGIRARALLKSDLKAALAEAGVGADAVERALGLLDACESARFTGKAGEHPPKELVSQARGVVAELARKHKKA